MHRKSLSKTARFEIFKRDQFTCLYCGRKPPSVTLQVDHVLAVANGGGNDESNLVTSCFDCNIGKGTRPVERRMPTLLSLQEQQERFEQLRSYEAFLAGKADQIADWLDQIVCHWAMRDGQPADAEVVYLHRNLESAAQKFLQRGLPRTEIINAIDIAFDRQPHSEHQRFLFFCGVCWKKIRDNEQPKATACT